MVAAMTLLTVFATPAAADDSPGVPEDVASVASEANVDPVDLLGAMVSTHEPSSADGARHYLRWVGELPGLPESPPLVHRSGARFYVRLTYYVYNSGITASGGRVYVGSTACSYNFAFGTRFELPDGSVVTCNDRGMLGASGWLDVYGRPDIGRLGAGWVTILN